MVGLIALGVFILLGVVALWVKGIDEMHEKHPDYKGEDLFGEETKLQCKDCNDNLTDCTCIEDTVDMKQWPESTGDIFSDYAIGESKAIQNSMHLDAEIACRSVYRQETIGEIASKQFQKSFNKEFEKVLIQQLKEQETTADYIDRHIVEAMVEVAKQEMYSKEDMKSSFQVGFNVGYNDEESPSYLTFEEWIKEYKKK